MKTKPSATPAIISDLHKGVFIKGEEFQPNRVILPTLMDVSAVIVAGAMRAKYASEDFAAIRIDDSTGVITAITDKPEVLEKLKEIPQGAYIVLVGRPTMRRGELQLRIESLNHIPIEAFVYFLKDAKQRRAEDIELAKKIIEIYNKQGVSARTKKLVKKQFKTERAVRMLENAAEMESMLLEEAEGAEALEDFEERE